MTAITMKNFMNALVTGELVINVKDENDKVSTTSVSIFDENGKLIPEITEYAMAQVEKIEEKNGKRGDKPTARQIENEGLKATLLETLEVGKAYTAKAIVDLELNGISSTQKATALMKQLVADGRATVADGKVKEYTVIG